MSYRNNDVHHKNINNHRLIATEQLLTVAWLTADQNKLTTTVQNEEITIRAVLNCASAASMQLIDIA